jgi:TetR/AcrR family transcriptional repressor of nem operon
MTDKSVGRPRSFDEHVALRHATDLFWEKGYAATSLDDLLAVMGVARSSFYATFGSKQKVLWAALALYTGELVGRMRDAAAAEPTPRQALTAVLTIAGCSVRPAQGCLFVNIATELAPTDAEVRRMAQDYLGEVDRLFASLLRQHGFTTRRASGTSAALMALTTGAVTLRKAGASEARVRAMLAAAGQLLD